MPNTINVNTDVKDMTLFEHNSLLYLWYNIYQWSIIYIYDT